MYVVILHGGSKVNGVVLSKHETRETAERVRLSGLEVIRRCNPPIGDPGYVTEIVIREES